jgi:hypothetical protein
MRFDSYRGKSSDRLEHRHPSTVRQSEQMDQLGRASAAIRTGEEQARFN